jgi:hypothetical protein
MTWSITVPAGSKIEEELLCGLVADAALVAVRVPVAEAWPSVDVPGASAPTMLGEAVAGVRVVERGLCELRPSAPAAVEGDALAEVLALDRREPARRWVLLARPTLPAGVRAALVGGTAKTGAAGAVAGAAGAGAGAGAGGAAAAAVAVGPAPFPLPFPALGAEGRVGAAEVWIGAAEAWVLACGLPLPCPRPSARPWPSPFPFPWLGV